MRKAPRGSSASSGPEATARESAGSRLLRRAFGVEGIDYDQGGPRSTQFAEALLDVVPPGTRVVETADIGGEVNHHEIRAIEAWLELDDGSILSITQQQLPTDGDAVNPGFDASDGTLETWGAQVTAFIVRSDESPMIRVSAPGVMTTMSVHPGPIWIWEGHPTAEEAAQLRKGFGLPTAALKRLAQRVTELPPGV